MIELKRNIYKDLEKWSQKQDRKPLILKWARQVWKSFAVENFSKTNNIKLHKINFQSQKDATQIFAWNQDSDTILTKIEYFLDTSINLEKDLLFFDEIQECPQAINSLKFLYEEKTELKIIWAGSYLWIMKNEESFPVWKVEYIGMFPLTFEEFTQAIDEKLYKFYQKIDVNNMQEIDKFFHQKLLDKFYLYLAVWWMPEIVSAFTYYSKEKSPNEVLNIVRKKQEQLLESYKSDFAKHWWVVNSNHILNVFEAISLQLSKAEHEETDKFKFSWVIANQKGYDRIIWPLTWLSKARLAIQSFIISDINQPIKAEYQKNKFKVFMHDIWLLNAELSTPISSLLNIKDSLWSYKWYIVENFIACELFSITDKNLCTWTKWQSEIEFLFEKWEYIIPIEAKSSTKSRKARSLDSYIQKYNPKFAYKFTAQNYWKNNWFETFPLYLIWRILKNRKY